MIKIALCDDDKQDLINVSKLVEEYMETHLTEYSISCSVYHSGADLIWGIEKGQVFDIFLLDIIMPLITGMELAEEIRTMDKLSKILFLSSTSEYAVDSYRIDAFYYLLKPVKREELFEQLTRAIQEIIKEEHNHIIVKRGAGLAKIALSEIQYAEIVEHTIHLYLKEGELIKNFGTMAQLESELLNDKRFIKPHRSYLLNMDCIANLSPKGISTIQGSHIPVSRSLYKEIKQAYIDYSFKRN